MYSPSPENFGLAIYYALAALVTGWVAWNAWRQAKFGWIAWVSALAGLFGYFSSLALVGIPPGFSEGTKDFFDLLLTPPVVLLGTIVVMSILFFGRRMLIPYQFSSVLMLVSVLLLGLALEDTHFAAKATAPDNIAVLGVTGLLAFFLWAGLGQGAWNDYRMNNGQVPMEARYRGRVYVWPDLVHIELIAMLLIMTLLIFWSLAVPAPLEPPADPSFTPNPAKAPWYFVGLQELLVYCDAWLIGVVLPGLAVFAMISLPYLDHNPRGVGYYTIEKRKLIVGAFLYGLVCLWLVPILMGTFFRGPNWAWFGLFEPYDPHRMPIESSVHFSTWAWGLVGRDASGMIASDTPWRFFKIIVRELPGLIVLGLYFFAIPPLLGATYLKKHRRAMGRMGFWIAMALLLVMGGITLKMLLRWWCSMDYLVYLPEYYLNV